MPYTPPARSPASSAPASPDVSRRSSIQHGTPSLNSSPTVASRPALPRSASYLTKHRRTPSASSVTTPSYELTPPGTSDNLKGMVANHNNTAVRQSPPPIADARAMPPGAIISPPDSQTSSEDEGTEATVPRGRQIENLKELQDAISAIPQHRQSSPDRTSKTSPGDLLVLPAQIENLVDAVQNSLKVDITQNTQRRISHNRSKTEPNFILSKSADASISTSDESESDDLPTKPLMVRKKSGELVRPALRPAASRRPSSMPGTPTFSKAVHFDSHLEHVRHFLQVDRPLAVSAGTSPADTYESDTEYPFDDKSASKTPPFEWELVMNNFPGDTIVRKALPARVERVWMSPDQKSLIGSIAVANLAFQKQVVCRFTFDYWKTTSEVAAEYAHEITPRQSANGQDQFQFTIKLSDMANLESKTLFFCVRYNVNGLEYWDNNDNLNFQVDFRKKALPQNGKGNFKGASSRPVNSLPRSSRRSNASTGNRPKSVPTFDDFGHDGKFLNFDQPIHEYLGESEPTMLRLKSSKSTGALPSDNLANRLSAPSGVAFANRYDFGVSLNAAKQAHKESQGSPRSDGLYMKPNKKAAFATQPTPVIQMTDVSTGSPIPGIASKVPGTDSPRISSASYEEIVNKYCFFNGSKQTSPQIKDGTLQNGKYDGTSDELFTRTTNSTLSSSNGSPDMADRSQHGTLRYAIHQNLNPYFQNQHIAIGASPAESPLDGPSTAMHHSLSPSSSATVTAGTSPAHMAGGFSPFAGTSPNFAVNTSSFHVHDRFPFTAEAHPSTAIRS
ncbi:putative phosphatase regulatory subunit-domain-containing protein [Truncatella angustata]|uniref:Phosphatase regulatory subunit-domain-containing protein n=1 Tax=Truncatella angustata TaxID=152316 RepID=A0A9P8UMA1_9PEZI|nr:putative phosphatase regulatory subunit-domain-containing protein [Truncatella angustata]KAH6654867.1 putative phosphatase regulatory subunit-domain-containing protein [Truncatella angustata]